MASSVFRGASLDSFPVVGTATRTRGERLEFRGAALDSYPGVGTVTRTREERLEAMPPVGRMQLLQGRSPRVDRCSAIQSIDVGSKREKEHRLWGGG